MLLLQYTSSARMEREKKTVCVKDRDASKKWNVCIILTPIRPQRETEHAQSPSFASFSCSAV